MILVDIGNTRIHYAQVKNKRIGATASSATTDATLSRISRVLTRYGRQDILICSVVPRVTNLFKAIRRRRGYSIVIAGIDVPIPIPCHYDKKEIGADRLIGAIGALTINRKTRLIIDCGSAITFDILSRHGEYEGGFILPGIGSSLRVLSSCALLPKKIILTPSMKITSRIPQRTAESIQRGITEGFAAMINELTKKYTQALKLSSQACVILTGGDAPLITPQLAFRYRYEPHLVFKGLLALAKKSG